MFILLVNITLTGITQTSSNGKHKKYSAAVCPYRELSWTEPTGIRMQCKQNYSLYIDKPV